MQYIDKKILRTIRKVVEKIDEQGTTLEEFSIFVKTLNKLVQIQKQKKEDEQEN